MYEVGGQILSKEKHRGNRVTIHGEHGKTWNIRLKYQGIEEHRFGKMHVYTVVAIEAAGPKKSKT